MTERYQGVLTFGRGQRRRIEAYFSGGEITSDAGVLLLRLTDRPTGLIDSAATALCRPPAVRCAIWAAASWWCVCCGARTAGQP